jgi:hypothetical protein
MAGNFTDERGYVTQLLDYLMSGTSPSEYKGAQSDINKLIADADKKAELAKIFQMQVGRENIGVYRHLDPADSTVTLLMGLADQYYRNENIPIETLLRKDAMSRKDSPMSMMDATRLLAQKRNQ